MFFSRKSHTRTAGAGPGTGAGAGTGDVGNDDAQEERGQSRPGGNGLASLLAVEDGIVYKPEAEEHTRWYRTLLDAGVEENGIKPVPVEKRTNTQYNNLFTVFFTGLLCILP